jgi:uncharacterized membrane protein YobD (UPF0266 family)
MARMNVSLGELHCRTVQDEKGKTIGAFLFFGRKNKSATVLNILSARGSELDVIRQMFRFLGDEDYALASGMAQPFLMNAFYRQPMMTFKHRGYFCITTSHEDLKQAALSNDIYIGGLASENWSRMLTDF